MLHSWNVHLRQVDLSFGVQVRQHIHILQIFLGNFQHFKAFFCLVALQLHWNTLEEKFPEQIVSSLEMNKKTAAFKFHI